MNRNGKIARLPLGVRTQLNQRLQNGQDGPEVLDWLNALPETKQILESQFAGVPVSPQNLSEWRNGGYREWELRQELLEHLDDATLDEDMIVVEKLLKVVTLKYAQLLAKWDGELTEEFQAKMKALGRLTRDITLLQRATEKCDGFREMKEKQRLHRNRMLLNAPLLLVNQGEKWSEVQEQKRRLTEYVWGKPGEKAENQTKSNQTGKTAECGLQNADCTEEKIKPNQTTDGGNGTKGTDGGKPKVEPQSP